MIPPNRDLLVLTNKIHLDPAQMEQEVISLQELLLTVENSKSFCIANEVIDLNRYKIITKPLLVQQAIDLKGNKPFIFINCKN